MENTSDNGKDEDAFGISQIQIIIPDKGTSEETPKKKKNKKKKRKDGSKDEKKKLPHSVVLARCLGTALKLVKHHEAQERQKIKDEDIRQKALEQKERMSQERPERFSRVIL
ncbi:uncharacterized protein [Lepeophtheirus salmonis]|uniref:uncharacterized protein isoform X2 n=1 Tax=Lepeophtheirus salmonis TaxID=72036 RepID=UPI001AE6C1CF|nr:uncharacterized protein LOC121127157 isoform X2 [Lepeophtheirus salmonis]